MGLFKKKSKDGIVEFVIKKLLPKAIEYDKKYKKNREDNRKFYKGDQWRRTQPSYKSKSVTNFLSLIVRDEVAILTDNPPIINVRPVDQVSDPAIADILTKIIKHIFYQNDFPALLHKACKINGIEGLSYFRPNWNPLLADGEGDIEILVEKADDVHIDPSGEYNYFIIEKELTLAEIYRYYPKIAPKVKADITKDDTTSSPMKNKPSLPVTSTDSSRTVIYEESQLDIATQYDKVKFHMAWIKDDAVEHIVEEDEKTKEKKDIYETKYPNGRWVFIANEKILLDDRPCPVKHMPLIPIILDLDPERDTAGISNIDYCKQSQVDYNEMYALIKDYLRCTVYPKTTYDPASGFDPNKAKNKWGAMWPVAPDKMRSESPAPLGNEAFRFIGEGKNNIEYISAMNDITQGRRPASVQAAEAIKLLQEASKTMIRPKSKLLEIAIKKLAIVLLDFIQYGYSKERILYLLGGERIIVNKPEIVKDVQEIKNNVMIGKYDAYIEPDSTLPVSRIERFTMMKDLAKEGMADRNSILDETGLPNKDELKDRMNEKEQQSNKQEQQRVQAEAQTEQTKIQQEQARVQSSQQVDMARIKMEQGIKQQEIDIKREELKLKKQEIALKAAIEANKPDQKKEQKRKK